jgi:peptidyl-prolyl cis-trans isomerase C
MKRFLWIAPIVCLLVTGCQDKKSPVLAKVGSVTITQSDLERKIGNLPKQLHAVATERKKDLVDDMVSEELLLQEAKRRGLDKLDDVKRLTEEADKKILVAKLIEQEIDKNSKAADPLEPLNYYDAHKEEFRAPLLLRASHILVKTEAEAKSLKSQLDLGADFEEMARAHSLDSTAKRGGDLGFFQQGQLLPEFEQAVLKMKKGQIAGPVETRYGFHIIKLTDRVEPAIRDFDSVRKILEERLTLARRKKALKDFLDKLKTKTSVTLNEKALA